MRTANLYLVYFLLILVALVSQAPAQTLERRIEEAVVSVTKEGGIAGVAVGVMHDGKQIFAKGYGQANIEHNVPVKPNTVFGIRSVTKQFTATSIMLLLEEGRISLEDKLSKFMPDFSRGDEVTIRYLLIHTSGIRNFTSSPEWSATNGTNRLDRRTDEMLQLILRQTPPYDFDPGTKYSYNNSGYFILGAIVEKISGMPLGEFYKERIFDKVSMTNSRRDFTREIIPNRASAYTVVQNQPGTFHNAAYVSMTGAGGAGSLMSTVEDLLKWHNALFNGKVVRPETLKQMITPGRLNNGELPDVSPISGAPGPHGGYGFGFFINEYQGRLKVGHGGGGARGWNAMIGTYPQEKLTIVVLSNSGNAGTVESAVTRKIFERLPAPKPDIPCGP